MPGVAAAAGLACVAAGIGRLVPLVGAPVSGIVLGVVIATVRRPRGRLLPGIQTASRQVLQVAVVLLGAQLSLRQVVRVGLGSLPVMIGTVTLCLVLAYLVGRWLRVSRDLRTLIGVGTSICGASAIAAITPVIGAASVDVAFAVSTIFLFNIAAVLAFPVIGHLLGLGQHSFGLFAGTAVNDVSSVVATSTTYGSAAAGYAVIVKLTRTLLIIPISFGLAGVTARRKRIGAAPGEAGRAEPIRLRRVVTLVPWFMVGFVLLAAANTVGLVPNGSHHDLARASTFLITTAMAAIGLSTDVAGFRRTGMRPILLGALLWISVSASSLGLQAVTGRL